MTNNRRDVFYIESVGASDLITEQSELDSMSSILKLFGYQSTFHRALGKDEFLRLLDICALSGCEILHISCHGNSEGLGMTDGEFVTWAEFFAAIEKCHSLDMIHLSSCGALASQRLSELYRASTDRPLHIMGSKDNVHWQEAAVAWAIIYNVFRDATSGNAFNKLTNAMLATEIATGQEFSVVFWTTEEDGVPIQTLTFSSSDIIKRVDEIGVYEYMAHGCATRSVDEAVTDDPVSEHDTEPFVGS